MRLSGWQSLVIPLWIATICSASPQESLHARYARDNPLWLRYCDAGVALYRQKKFPESYKYLVAAFNETKKFGEHDPRLAMCQVALGYWCREQEQYSQAERWWKSALPVLEQAQEPEPSNRTRLLSDLGNCLWLQGKNKEAEPFMLRARDIYARAFGVQHRYVQEVDQNIASMRANQAHNQGKQPQQ